jgi:hypothetical protein
MNPIAPSAGSNDLTVISYFNYPRASLLHRNKNEQKARLDYMISRIRAALREWFKDKEYVKELEGLDMWWWWNGIQKELVCTKHI